MKKRSALLFSMLLLLFAACDHSKIVIRGRLSEPEAGMLYLHVITPEGNRCIDSADITHGKFKFVFPPQDENHPEYPYYYRLSQGPFNTLNTMARQGERLDFQINNRIMVKNYQVAGGDDALLMWQLDRNLEQFIDTVDALYRVYELNLYDDLRKQEIEEKYAVLVDHHAQELLGFIGKNNRSFAALTAFYQSYNRRVFLRETDHLDLLRELAASLEKQYPSHEYVLYLANQLHQKYEY